jgi:hypothetical protein
MNKFKPYAIETDSEEGRKLGFTSDLYEGVLFMYEENCIYLALVFCSAAAFKALLDRLIKSDYIVHVITAAPEWAYYCRRKGMSKKLSYSRNKYPGSNLRFETMEI